MTIIRTAKNKFMSEDITHCRALFEEKDIQQFLSFQQSHPNYTKTPLYELKALAQKTGIASILVKDESKRFGLNAFKVLGGIVAVGKYLSEKLGVAFENLSFEELKQQCEKLPIQTFITATDGNHGRGVAWAARELGHKSVVKMPKGSTEERLQAIKDEGAEAEITVFNYDDCVRHCAELAQINDWVVVQDTAWAGYEEIPLWIMQGYGTLALEIAQQLEEQQLEPPTHVLLQAGVGSFAGAVAICLETFLNKKLTIGIVESNKADCYYHSFKEQELTFVGGDMQTVMAGLACGEPNQLAFQILSQLATATFSCEDEVTALGMRLYANPVGDDVRIISGESGAVTLGLLYYAMNLQSSEEIAKALNLDQHSRVLVISTEGDTDRASYEKIVWQGQFEIKGET